jgi:hypothetical protein
MSTFIPGPDPETNIGRHKISLKATGYIFKIYYCTTSQAMMSLRLEKFALPP